MAEQSNFREFGESLIKMLKDKNVASFEINGKTFIPKNDALKAIIDFCEESLSEGDQNKGILNLGNLMKFKKAYETSFLLFDNISHIDIVCRDNLSYASATIECLYFGFDIENIKRKMKSQYMEFSELIDSMEISSGVSPGQIRINFTVNDVWVE